MEMVVAQTHHCRVLPSSRGQGRWPQLLCHSVQVGALCFGMVLQKRMPKQVLLCSFPNSFWTGRWHMVAKIMGQSVKILLMDHAYKSFLKRIAPDASLSFLSFCGSDGNFLSPLFFKHCSCWWFHSSCQYFTCGPSWTERWLYHFGLEQDLRYVRQDIGKISAQKMHMKGVAKYKYFLLLKMSYAFT